MGTEEDETRDFNLTAARFDYIEVSPSGTSYTIRAVPGDEYGFALDGRWVGGFSISIGYDISRKFTLSLVYDYYFSRHGYQVLTWTAPLESQTPYRHGVLEYESAYRHVTLGLGVEYRLPWWGLSVLASREASMAIIEEDGTWLWYDGDLLYATTTYERDGNYCRNTLSGGLGVVRLIGARVGLALSAMWAFNSRTGGGTIRAGLRYHLF